MDEPQGKLLDLRTVFGLQATVTQPAADTGGAYVEMDVTAEPGCRTTIHYHPEQEETYQVVEGALEVFHDATWQTVSTGQSLTIPPKAVHGFRNTSDAPVRFLNVHRPALAFQEHLETLAWLARTGKIKGTRDPRSLIYMSMSATRYQPDVTVKPPQRLVRSLAFIGQRLGFKLDDAPRD